MRIVTDRLRVATRGDSEILDLTADVQALVGKHGFREGQALVFVPGSTAGITTIEYEPGLLQDVPAAFERLAPKTCATPTRTRGTTATATRTCAPRCSARRSACRSPTAACCSAPGSRSS